MTFVVVVLAALAVLLLLYLAASIKIVRPYQRGIIERLGRYKETTDPGLKVILALVDTMRRVDMREQVIDVPPQEVITADNVVVSVDAVIYYEATDPQRLIYNVANFILATTKLAQTNLRNLVGDLQLDEALTSRDRINMTLREILDDATDKWGVRVVRVEIQRIDPPAEVVSAMHEQMKAERTRRAVVTEAQGVREAEITRAEGDKQAAILDAEGFKQAEITRAEGDAQAVRTRAEAERFRLETTAEGTGNATRLEFAGIHDGDPTTDLLAVRYLQALGEIADGQATKIVVPMELSGILGAVAGVAEVMSDGHNQPAEDKPAAAGAGERAETEEE